MVYTTKITKNHPISVGIHMCHIKPVQFPPIPHMLCIILFASIFSSLRAQVFKCSAFHSISCHDSSNSSSSPISFIHASFCSRSVSDIISNLVFMFRPSRFYITFSLCCIVMTCMLILIHFSPAHHGLHVLLHASHFHVAARLVPPHLFHLLHATTH